MSAVGISIQDATFAYSNSPPVLNDLNLDIAPGEVVALLGASGCGKSTLLKAVANLITLQSGEILFDGEQPTHRSGDFSFVFQDANLLPWRTVRQNVELPTELGAGRVIRGERDLSSGTESLTAKSEAIESVLHSVQLPEAAFEKFPRELSGGMRMRTSIARALVTDPSILLLDEPFAALDDLLRTRLNELVLELWSQHKRTIVFVTHNIAEAVFLSHRVAILAHGKIACLLENKLAWPRESEQRVSPEFAAIYASISQALAEAQES
ncbi:MAG: ABC transporter ATP-binding protein [Planctomycetota bacterium]|nr:ABC transporter ATP-binding protein [Planctomycetota bacterium]